MDTSVGEREVKFYIEWLGMVLLKMWPLGRVLGRLHDDPCRCLGDLHD